MKTSAQPFASTSRVPSYEVTLPSADTVPEATRMRIIRELPPTEALAFLAETERLLSLAVDQGPSGVQGRLDYIDQVLDQHEVRRRSERRRQTTLVVLDFTKTTCVFLAALVPFISKMIQ